VLALQHDIEVARQAAAVAASERRPNVTWEVSYGQRTGYSDMVSVGVSIPLQVAPAERQDRDTAAKLALVDKAEAELAEATRAATAEYRVLASDAQRLQERIERYRSGVVTPAQQRTAVAMAAYRSNQATLASLFEARHAEVEVQRKLLSLQRELAKAQAQLAYKPLVDGGAQ
jgi:outer membrane protein TolC